MFHLKLKLIQNHFADTSLEAGWYNYSTGTRTAKLELENLCNFIPSANL